MSDTSLVFNLVARDQASHALEGIKGKFGALGLGVGALFSAGLKQTLDASEANSKLADQLGLNKAEAQRAGDVSGAVFSHGFGESIGSVDDALGAVASSMGGFSKLSSKELTDLSEDALALADRFEFDVGASSQAAGNLIKSGLAKNGTEAFDLLTAAAQKLPPKLREELPDLTNEYSEFFGQLGFTGPQMMGLLAQGAKDPLFQIDKLGDAVKEFTLRIGNTKAVSAPLKQIGLDVGHIQKLIATGHGTKAFDEVTTALKGVHDQTQRTQLQAALFGGPGEDMGNTLLKLNASGAAAETGLDKAAGAAQKVKDHMAASPGQMFNSVMRTLSTTLAQALAPALAAVTGFLQKHPGLMRILPPIILAVAGALGIATAATWAMNSALLANPVFWIIAGITALVLVIVAIATKTTWFQTIWNTVWGAIKTATAATVNWISSALHWFAGLPGKFSHWWGSAKDWAIRKMLSMVAWVTGLPGRARNALAGLAGAVTSRARAAFQAMRDAAVAKASAMIGWVRGLPGRIKSGIGGLTGLLASKGRDFIRGLWNGISGMGGWLWSKVKSFVKNNVVGAAKSFLHIGSPSKLAADEIGQWIPAGVAMGVQDNAGVVDQAMRGLVKPELARPAPLTTGMAPQMGAATGGGVVIVRLETTGAENNFKKFVRGMVRVDGRGSVQTAFS